ncbi:PhzF family phenazine biosynthesis protein [Limibaculum sp. M0105]|uniref:PhzF family phenazine biosynthesis protein n=1 Tax=Thermohalobaculum xanthum TaxID=2753746 RepID=A0A8J7M773_9RHOB|nr:PhzF family phenazine biosynthesis protein [Thermohalobaculum xanthum]MBK0398970.1 PhzF family phenazine biosynthesis protein [Thermohalobaculum xanthum]
MTARQTYWVDAFTDRPMGGNPCAVMFGADDLDEATRLAFTRETRLSECSFVVASDKADFGARYYLASREIKMAGHPTIATCVALDRAGLIGAREAFTLEVGAGVVQIEVDRRGVLPAFTMTQYAPVFGNSHAPEAIAPLFGLAPDDVVGMPQTVSTGGPNFCVTVLRDLDALERARLDIPALESVRPEVDFWEPFLCVTRGFTSAGDTAARLMLTPPEPAEDPFTGSATGCMAAYLWRHGMIRAPRFTAEQGHLMERPGSARVEVLGPPDAIDGVKVGGTGVVLFEGTAHL